MQILIDVLAVYVLYAFVGIAIIMCFSSRERLEMSAVVVLFPALLVAAVPIALFAHPTIPPCPVGLDGAEDLVEEERRRLFGGTQDPLAIADAWKKAYAISLEIQAERVRRVPRFIRRHFAAA